MVHSIWRCSEFSFSGPWTDTRAGNSGGRRSSENCPWCWTDFNINTETVNYQNPGLLIIIDVMLKQRMSEWTMMDWWGYLLGTLLIALSGRRTLTVLMAVRLMFCRSSEYSTILGKHAHYKLINKLNAAAWPQFIRLWFFWLPALTFSAFILICPFSSRCDRISVLLFNGPLPSFFCWNTHSLTQLEACCATNNMN